MPAGAANGISRFRQTPSCVRPLRKTGTPHGNLTKISDAAAFAGAIGFAPGLETASGLLGGRHRHRPHQRPVRRPLRQGAGLVSDAHGRRNRLARLPAAGRYAGRFRRLRVAVDRAVSRRAGQRHPAGHRRAPSARGRGPQPYPVAEARSRQDCPDGDRPVQRRFHRPRGSDRAGRRLGDAAGGAGAAWRRRAA